MGRPVSCLFKEGMGCSCMACRCRSTKKKRTFWQRKRNLRKEGAFTPYQAHLLWARPMRAHILILLWQLGGPCDPFRIVLVFGSCDHALWLSLVYLNLAGPVYFPCFVVIYIYCYLVSPFFCLFIYFYFFSLVFYFARVIINVRLIVFVLWHQSLC